MKIFTPTFEQRVADAFDEAQHALLLAEAEEEVYQAGHMTAAIRVEMLRQRVERLRAQVEGNRT